MMKRMGIHAPVFERNFCLAECKSSQFYNLDFSYHQARKQALIRDFIRTAVAMSFEEVYTDSPTAYGPIDVFPMASVVFTYHE